MTDLHTSYEEIANRPCDFIVKYKFFTSEEGGRTTGPPVQGYRSDFMYSDNPNEIFIIHPEFIDDNDNVILGRSITSWSGKAKMWILNSHYFKYHKENIKIGVKGFFMEGNRKTAECEVIEIVRLKEI